MAGTHHHSKRTEFKAKLERGGDAAHAVSWRDDFPSGVVREPGRRLAAGPA